MPKWPVQTDATEVTVNTYTYTNTLTMSYIPKRLNLLPVPKPEALLTRIQDMVCFKTSIHALHFYWHSQNTEITLSANVRWWHGNTLYELVWPTACEVGSETWVFWQWSPSDFGVHSLMWLVEGGPMMFHLQRGKEGTQDPTALDTYINRREYHLPSLTL